MEKTRKLKDNEILIFTDFNNTLVDYASEYDYRSEIFDDFDGFIRSIKNGVSRCLNEFERQTVLTPVVCIVTNASFNIVDKNGYNGICHDLMMTFFNHKEQKKENAEYEIQHSCERFIKFVLHKENDGYLEINPYGTSMNDTFIPHRFSDSSLQIKRKSVKRESVERMIGEIGPIKNKFVIFAGDSIADDYPMKYAVTGDGVSRIFIRPGRASRIKPSIKQQFCEAKGISFNCINPKNNKKIKVIDGNSLQFLSEEQKQQLENFDDGDSIFLTSPNSKGFVEGIYRSIEVIKNLSNCDKERDKDI